MPWISHLKTKTRKKRKISCAITHAVKAMRVKYSSWTKKKKVERCIRENWTASMQFSYSRCPLRWVLVLSREAVTLACSLSTPPPPYASPPGRHFWALADDEHSLGTSTPSLPILLFETEHPNPSLSHLYSDLIWSNYMCSIHVLCLQTSFFFAKNWLDIHVYTRPFFFDNIHPCPLLGLCPCKQCLGWALKWTKLQIPPNCFVASRSSSAVISSLQCYYLSVLASLCAMVLSVLRSYLVVGVCPKTGPLCLMWSIQNSFQVERTVDHRFTGGHCG